MICRIYYCICTIYLTSWTTLFIAYIRTYGAFGMHSLIIIDMMDMNKLNHSSFIVWFVKYCFECGIFFLFNTIWLLSFSLNFGTNMKTIKTKNIIKDVKDERIKMRCRLFCDIKWWEKYSPRINYETSPSWWLWCMANI